MKIKVSYVITSTSSRGGMLKVKVCAGEVKDENGEHDEPYCAPPRKGDARDIETPTT